MIAFKTKSMKEISRYIYSNWNNNSPEAYQIFTNSDFYRFTMRKLHYAIYNYLRYRSTCKRVWFELRHPTKSRSVFVIILYDDQTKEYTFEHTYKYDKEYMPSSQELTFNSMYGELI